MGCRGGVRLARGVTEFVVSLRGIVYILHETSVFGLAYECWQTVLCFLAFGANLLGLWGNLFVGLQLRVLFDSPGCFHGSELLSRFLFVCPVCSVFRRDT